MNMRRLVVAAAVAVTLVGAGGDARAQEADGTADGYVCYDGVKCVIFPGEPFDPEWDCICGSDESEPGDWVLPGGGGRYG